MANPSNLSQVIYVDYIATLHKSVLSSVITYNPSIPLTSNTNYTINKTVSSTTLHLTLFITTAHQNSYVLRTINDRNMLPIHLLKVTDTDTFETELQFVL